MFRQQGIVGIVLALLKMLIPISDRLASGDASDEQMAEGGLLAMGKEV
jgi:hypothetical protein